MNIKIIEKIPLVFLAIISAWWAFYYQSNLTLNDFGAANYEWLYLIDGLLVVPIICFVCIKDHKQAALKALIYCCLVILIGSYIIPESNKVIWHYLESGRFFVLAAFIVIELVAIATVYLAISTALKRNQDPDLAISKPFEKIFGSGVLAKLFTFETRMWSFTLFAKNIKMEDYTGTQYFSYHKKDGGHSNMLGFIIILLIELPLAHALLYFIWSPMAANIVSLLTAFSLVFFIAEYRAVSRRPISVDKDKIYIRMGLFNVCTINLNNIKSIQTNKVYIQRSKTIKRYNLAGYPNIILHLKNPDKEVERIYLGLDHPNEFREYLKFNQY